MKYITLFSYLIFIISLLNLSSCYDKANERKSYATRKLAVYYQPHIFFYNDTNLIKKVRINKQFTRLRSFDWLDDKDELILYIKKEISKNDSSNYKGEMLCVMNTNGIITDTIFYNPENQYISQYFVSYGDSLLLLKLEKPIQEIKSRYLYDILIYSIRFKHFIDTIESDIRSSRFIVHNSPWSPDNKKVVYENFSYKDFKKSSINIYNLETKKDKLIKENAEYGIWEPNGSRIAYILNERELYTYNTENGKHKKIFSVASYSEINSITWTPDGKYIFVQYTKDFFKFKLLAAPKNRFVDSRTGKVAPLQVLSSRAHFSWKD